MKLLNHLLLIFLFIPGSAISQAQTPGWSWAKGEGGDCQESLIGNLGRSTDALHIDSAGNMYELVTSQSSTISFGAFAFSNPTHATPASSGRAMTFFVKHDPRGTVLWAKNLVYYAPYSVYTDEHGVTAMLFPFYDSIRIGNMFLRDSTINMTHSGYCIARFDAGGNVFSLHAYATPYTDWYKILPLHNGNMIAMGFASNDTLSGIPVPKSCFLSIMDSIGRVTKVKSIGYDTAVYFISTASQFALGGNSIYMTVMKPLHVYFYPDAVPIAHASDYSERTILIRMDTALNYQWHMILSNTIGRNLVGADPWGNVYLDVAALSSFNPPDTLAVDTDRVPLPYVGPPGQNEYVGLVKISPFRHMEWANVYLSAIQYSAIINAFCTDRMANVYAYGLFPALTQMGPVTLTGGDAFVAKFSKDGAVKWGQTFHGRLRIGGIVEDGHGNVFINGLFAYSTVHNTWFGHDTIVCHTPISGYPLAADVFLARLGDCHSAAPLVASSSPLHWCGTDSVTLSVDSAAQYLWSTGDTSRSLIVRSSGLYSVAVADTLGCYATSQPQAIAAHSEPVLSAMIARNVSCRGGTDGQIVVVADSASLPYHFSSAPSAHDLAHVGAGSYIIYVSDSFGCMASDTVRVSEPATVLSVHASSTGSQAFATATGATPPYSYLWSNAAITDTVSSISPGWYIVTVTDANGCRAKDSAYILAPNSVAMIEDPGISIYPNPGKDMITIHTPAVGTAMVYDQAGRMVYSRSLRSGTNIWDISALPAAVYTIDMMIQSDKHYRSQLVIDP